MNVGTYTTQRSTPELEFSARRRASTADSSPLESTSDWSTTRVDPSVTGSVADAAAAPPKMIAAAAVTASNSRVRMRDPSCAGTFAPFPRSYAPRCMCR